MPSKRTQERIRLAIESDGMASGTARLRAGGTGGTALGVWAGCGGATASLLLALTQPAGAHGTLTERTALAEASAAEDPTDPSTHLRLAAMARDAGDTRSALASLARAEQDAAHLDRWVRARIAAERGFTWLSARDFPSAAAALDRAVTAYSAAGTPAAVFSARARARAGSGDLAGAVEDYDRAVDTSTPPTPALYLERADALRRMLQPERALRGLDQGLAELGEPVTLALAAVEIERAMGRYENALSRLDLAARGARLQSHWQVRRARVLEDAGELGRARQSFSQALIEIRQLPAARRRSAAIQDLEREATRAIQRLSSGVDRRRSK